MRNLVLLCHLVLLLCLLAACGGQDLKLSDTINVAEYLKDEVDLAEILLPHDHGLIPVTPDVVVDASSSGTVVDVSSSGTVVDVSSSGTVVDVSSSGTVVDASLSDAAVDASLSPDVAVDASLSPDVAVDASSSSELFQEEVDTLLPVDYDETIDTVRDDEQVEVNNVIFSEDFGSPEGLLGQCITENAFISQLNQEKLELFESNIRLSASNQLFYDVLKKYNIADLGALDAALAAVDAAPTPTVTDNHQGPTCDACPVLQCPLCDPCPARECPINPPSDCSEQVQQNELLKDKLETFEIKVKLSKNDQAIAEANYQNCFLQSEANMLELKYNEKKLRSQIDVCENELNSLNRKVGSAVEYKKETATTSEKAAANEFKGSKGAAKPATEDSNETVPQMLSAEQVHNMIKTSLSYMNSTISSIPVGEIKESGVQIVGYTYPIILAFFSNALKLYIYYMIYVIGSVIIPGAISLHSDYLLPLYNQYLSATVTQVLAVISGYYDLHVGPIAAAIAANEHFVLYVIPLVGAVTEAIARLMDAVATSYNEGSSDEYGTLIYDFIVKCVSFLCEFTAHYVLDLVRLIRDTHVFQEYTDAFAYTSVGLLILVTVILARRFIFGVILLFFIILLAPLFLVMYLPMKALTSVMRMFKKMMKPFTKKGKRKSASADAQVRSKVVEARRSDAVPPVVARSNSSGSVNGSVNGSIKGPVNGPMNSEFSVDNAPPAFADTSSMSQSQLRYKLSP